MGHGARGLLRQRRRVALVSWRGSAALLRIHSRDGKHWGSVAAALFVHPLWRTLPTIRTCAIRTAHWPRSIDEHTPTCTHCSFVHEHARSRAYRWNEDGLAGWCNRFQNVVLSLAFWNGRDPILKERLFGLGGCVAHAADKNDRLPRSRLQQRDGAL